MFKTRRGVVSVLAAGALLLPLTLSAKHPVERPFGIHGTVTVTISLADGSLVGSETGVATQVGPYTNAGTGFFDLSTGNGTATGTMTAANGDQLFWAEVLTPGSEPGRSVVSRTFTGGSGRFTGATGGFTFETTPEVAMGPSSVIVTFQYTATGTITY